jgi:hypothetical protein
LLTNNDLTDLCGHIVQLRELALDVFLVHQEPVMRSSRI